MEFENLSTLRASILTYVEQDFERRVRIQVSAEHPPIEYQNVYNAALLPIALDQINHILAGPNFPIDPELSNLLHRFHLDCERLKRIMDLDEKYPIPDEETAKFLSKMELVSAIEETMRTAVKVREWLTGRGDRHLTEETLRQLT
jgi:hypothetical protein